MQRIREKPVCMIVRPPSGYATGNKPNIKQGLYLLPQALPYLTEAVLRCGATPTIVDLEANSWSLRRFLTAFKEESPDVIMFTTTTPSFCYCRAMSAAIKRISPEKPIVFGGSHPTYAWKSILDDEIADVVVLGEGELAVPQILRILRHGGRFDNCNGIAFRDESGIPVLASPGTRRSDSRPLGIPVYEYLSMETYRDRVGKCSIETVRGCPRGCRFCLNSRYYPCIRYKPVEDVAREVEMIVDEYGFRELSIVSPEFISDPEYVSELCDILESLLRGTEVTWACATTARSLSRAILQKMARAHCRSIFIGVESGSQEVQSIAAKQVEMTLMVERLTMVKDVGIGLLASFILGLPGETEATARQTLLWARTLHERFSFRGIQFNTFGPFPGTEFRETISTYGGRIIPIDPAYYTVVPAVESNQFPQDTHMDLWHEVWQAFFPDYYDSYLQIEEAALKGKNPRLEAFCDGTGE